MNDQLRALTVQRKRAHSRLAAMGAPVYAAFLDMERAAYADGALTKRHKELIAVGISVVLDCRSCMQWHIEQAATAGAGPAEVLEAVEVGIEMGGGPATVSARFALEVMDEVFGPRRPDGVKAGIAARRGQGTADGSPESARDVPAPNAPHDALYDAFDNDLHDDRGAA
ncbi:carboxymuconolactone decarboxylase family protein [Nitratidesulfovibrio liaohensis]|uniref:Carboxymuconolactone decarboxylase family protein n=1 Tax=Nitratidesulfovibrio liaohensis TaxID=2604158 RepID=A0ABY9R4Z4_9BACT|nr:carboxymuconolactone decarboxylase family protein [Nitratidesulfovibrio liaohensis]